MRWIEIWALLAFMLSVTSYIPYLYAVMTDKTKPTLSAWVSWGLMDCAILAGMYQADTIAWQMVAYLSGVGLVLAASIYKGAALGWTRFDTACVSMVAVAAVGWLITNSAELMISLAVAATVIGTIPLIRNLISGKGTESLLAWVLVLIGGIFGVLAIPHMSIAGALMPVVFVLVQTLVVTLILLKQSDSRLASN